MSPKHVTPTSPRCEQCTGPVNDSAYVCRRCAAGLAKSLAGAADLAAQLETSFARQAVHGRRVGDRSRETPLPYSPPAAEVLRAMRNTAGGWVRIVVTERPDTWPRDDVAAMCRWLAQPARLEWLRRHPAAGEAFTDLHGMTTGGWDVVDTPPELKDLGTCGAPTAAGTCAAWLAVKPDELHVTCRSCGAVHDVQARREQILAESEDKLMPASWIAFVASGLGQRVTAAMVYGYEARGRLESPGVDADGVRLFRVGEVLDLVAAARSRPKRKARSA